MRAARDLRDAKDREAAQAQAKLLAGAVIGISARAAAGGRLFGSVGPAMRSLRRSRARRASRSTTTRCSWPSTSRRSVPPTSPSSSSTTWSWR